MATPLKSLCVGRIATQFLTCRLTQPMKNSVIANTVQIHFTGFYALHSSVCFSTPQLNPYSSSNQSATNTKVNNFNLPASRICGHSRKGLLSALQSPLIQPVRHKIQIYRKRITTRQKRQSIIKNLVGAKYEFSGDLRQIKDFPEDTIYYPYEAFEDELKNDEVLKKLSSLEFASDEQKFEHKEKLVVDRIISLFGQDSELEQRIAKDTLFIRANIPVVLRDYYKKIRHTHYPKKWRQWQVYIRILERREDLSYLRKMDHERFEWLLKELKIRYVIPKDGQPIFVKLKDAIRDETLDAASAEKRKKLEELKVQLAKEKEAFYEHKAQVLSEIDRDLESYGLTRNHLKAMIEEDKEKKNPREYKDYSWEERVQLGITGRINKLI